MMPDDAHVILLSLKRVFKLELPHHLDGNNNNDGMNLCASLLLIRTGYEPGLCALRPTTICWEYASSVAQVTMLT
jgi:hypothetical protein